MAARARRGLEKILALRCVRFLDDRHINSGMTYSPGRCWATASSGHIAAVGEIFLIVAYLVVTVVSIVFIERLLSRCFVTLPRLVAYVVYICYTSSLTYAMCSHTCRASVAQHGYWTVAMSQLHCFVKMGIGSQ